MLETVDPVGGLIHLLLVIAIAWNALAAGGDSPQEETR